MSKEQKQLVPPSPVVALAGWLVPGLGYWLIGHKTRGLLAGTTILSLFVAGLLIGGVRVIDVPGFGPGGETLRYPDGRWALTASPLQEIRQKPWAVPQLLTGPVFLIGSAASLWASPPGASGAPLGVRSHVHLRDIGTLYLAVAGMLNLLVMIDSAHRAGRGGLA